MKFTKFSFEFLKENMGSSKEKAFSCQPQRWKHLLQFLADFEGILLRMNRYSNYKNYIEYLCSCMKYVKPVQKVVSYDAIQNQRNIIFQNCQRMTETVPCLARSAGFTAAPWAVLTNFLLNSLIGCQVLERKERSPCLRANE